MEKIFTDELRKNDRVLTTFMLRDAAAKSDKNGNTYLDIVLGDSHGEINAKMWRVDADTVETISSWPAGTIVGVQGNVGKFGETLQISIEYMRPAPPEEYDAGDFFKKAPEDSEEMWQYLYEKARAISDEDLKKMAVTFLEENKERLLFYPGAARNHHAEYGGLLWHMKRMAMNGLSMCSIYTNVNADLVLTGVILHDMEKLNEINAMESGMADGYTTEGKLLGHIAMGVKEISKMAQRLEIPEEKELALEHMILSHHYEPEFGSPIKPLFPEAEMLHYLDMIDAKMYDMEDVLQNVENGDFAPKKWTLDNRALYKTAWIQNEE